MKREKLLVIFIPIVLIVTKLHAQDILPYPSMAESSPNVHTFVEPVGSAYEYSYLVANGVEALQQIEEFMVQTRSISISGLAPSGWWISKATRPTLAAVTWASLDSIRDISPGSSLSGFQITSSGVPAVVQFYAVGRIPIPHGEFRIVPGTNDPFINSAQGRTIGPADPPTPFNALTFLDTITSYITESRALGWITDDATANKYRRLIDTARFHLEAKNRGITKTKLDSVLVNVHPDSAAGLITSEAYALIRFNTEYVLKKLREEER